MSVNNLTAELVLEILAEEAGYQDWVPYYDVHSALEERGFDLDTRRRAQLDKLDRLYKALAKRGLVESELRGRDLYDRDRYFRLTDQGRARVADIQESAVEAPPLTLGPRHRVSPLAERTERTKRRAVV